jgi:hypothetical protein
MRTANEMFVGFLNVLNRQNTLGADPHEFNYHVKVGQVEYLKMRYWAFERHQKSLDDLEKITVITNGIAGAPSPIGNAGAAVAGSEYFPLPANILGLNEKIYLLKVRFKLQYKGNACQVENSASRWITARLASHNRDERNVYVRDNDEKLYYHQTGGNIIRHAEFSSSVATHALLHYLRMPREITVDPITGLSVTNPELGPIQNTEIVKWTVASYLEKIESYRHQSMLQVQGLVFNNQDRLPA